MKIFYSEYKSTLKIIERNVNATDIIADNFIVRIRENGVLIMEKNHDKIFELKVINGKIEIEQEE